MEDTLGSVRRRVSSFNPNTMTYTTFSRNYVSYLLPALLKAANGDINTVQIEKIVRYEVDMALVLSTDEFKWSRALKDKLEESSNTNKHRISSKCRSKLEFRSHFGILRRFEHLQTFAVIPRPITVAEAARPRNAGQRSNKKRVARGDEELACRIRILRRILPGGSEMGVFELLSEVQSYLVFLQLQVDVLRSLVDAQ